MMSSSKQLMALEWGNIRISHQLSQTMDAPRFQRQRRLSGACWASSGWVVRDSWMCVCCFCRFYWWGVDKQVVDEHARTDITPTKPHGLWSAHLFVVATAGSAWLCSTRLDSTRFYSNGMDHRVQLKLIEQTILNCTEQHGSELV